MAVYETDLVERGRAWTCVATGELTRACELLAAAAARAEAADLRFAEARLLHDIARLGRAGEVAPRLATLAGLVDGELVAALAGHAAALARSRPAELEAAGHAFEAFGTWLLAAEAYQAAAASYRSRSDSRRANAAARHAAELAARCGSVQTPGLAPGTEADRLTRREREIAGLAAAGASSREIAARLVLSIRTVDNHLQSAYSKLGVTSRDELARILRSS
jgi:DNA-binding CsgD family transcriptional regulator